MVEAVKIVEGSLEVLGIKIPAALVNSVLTLIVIILFLALYKRVLRRLVNLRVLDRVYYEKLYRVTELTIIIVAILAITYYITGEHVLVYVIAGMALIVAASSWQIIASLISFYILLFSRIVNRGDYIILPSGPQGRVRDINLLYTLLETPHGVYAVPNLEIVRKGRLLLRDISQMRIVIRIWGFEDPTIVTDLRTKIMEVLEEKLADVAVHGAIPRIYVDEVSMDSVTFKAVVPVSGPRPNLSRLSEVLVVMANSLKELGYSYTITLEHTEGFEQRWRAVA